ncbi:MAG: hypothetical protein Q7R50_02950 [Dehalococcoidales bacterium]|nr:hypothetical protein [Dehalococcoidales bacterium]
MNRIKGGNVYQNEYQKRCQAARDAFASRKVVNELFNEEVDPKLMKLFMISWSALSSGLTQPIPEYLKRAGENCAKKGVAEMAAFFAQHTEEEDGHDEWGRDDTRKLVERWNKEEPEFPLNAEDMLKNNMSPAVKRYHKLHENVIDGDSPWAELAIDVEIELITTQYGPRLLQSCVRSMGEDSLADVSFLREHVRFDVGHTETNFETIHKLITKHPEYTDALVETAFKALESYADFLDDAMSSAKKIFKQISASVPLGFGATSKKVPISLETD